GLRGQEVRVVRGPGAEDAAPLGVRDRLEEAYAPLHHVLLERSRLEDALVPPHGGRRDEDEGVQGEEHGRGEGQPEALQRGAEPLHERLRGTPAGVYPDEG